MQSWKKQILKKNRFSSHEQITREQTKRQNMLYECIDKMQNHFCRLLSFYIRLKNSQNHHIDIFDYSVLSEALIQTPQDLNQKQEKKLVHTLYRRVKLVLANFQDQEIFVKYFDDIFNQQKEGNELILQNFFRLICGVIAKQIYAIKKEIERQKRTREGSKSQSSTKQNFNLKPSHKRYSEILCESIYNNLDLQQIDTCFLLIEEASLTDNINYVYERIKGRNKKIAKQINAHEKKMGLRKYSELKNYWSKETKKVSPTRQTTKKMSISKGKGVKIEFKSLSKSLSKKGLNQKSKLKLDPIIKREKIKLKIIR